MTRSTEVQMVLDNKGMDRGITMLFSELLERQAALESDMKENAAIILHAITLLTQVTDGAGAMREQMEKMQRGGDDDDAPNASS